MTRVVLNVVDYEDPRRWRWQLMRPNGSTDVTSQVDLNSADAESTRFFDLARFVENGNSHAEKIGIIEQTAQFIGQAVLGPIGGRLLELFEAAPTVVEVRLPAAARALAAAPMFWGMVGERNLARLPDLSFVICPTDADAQSSGPALPERIEAPEPAEDGLRVLAVFCTPSRLRRLALRNERRRLIHAIEKSVDGAHLRVAQYGVTTSRLRDLLDEGPGWDVIHFSGHGTADGLYLEDDAGGPVLVNAEELCDLFGDARGRLKLLTLSSCSSAGNRTIARLGLAPYLAGVTDDVIDDDGSTTTVLPGIALELTSRLRCGVLAMRYPVDDRFASEFAGAFYRSVIGRGVPVARAVPRAVRDATQHLNSDDDDPLAPLTPVLFGTQTNDLVLKPRNMARDGSQTRGKEYGVPLREAEYFVGRTTLMNRVMSDLDVAGGDDFSCSGVVLVGAPGAGKTAVASEIVRAVGKDDCFARYSTIVWYRAGDNRDDGAVSPAAELCKLFELLDGAFASTLSHYLLDSRKLQIALAELQRLLSKNRVLVVLDQVDALLTSDGRWTAKEWKDLYQAIQADRGSIGRMIITARQCPAGTFSLTEHRVESLTPAERFQCARELPNLGRLIRGEMASPVGVDSDRVVGRLLEQVLDISTGNPQALLLTDGRSNDLSGLTDYVQSVVDAVARGNRGFPANVLGHAGGDGGLAYRSGGTENNYEPDEHGGNPVTDGLAPHVVYVLRALACLERDDRTVGFLRQVLTHVGEPARGSADTVDVARCLQRLRELQLAYPVGPDGPDAAIDIPTTIGPALRAETPADLRVSIDAAAAEVWATRSDVAMTDETVQAGGTVIVDAGQRAVPYLLRTMGLQRARILIERILSRDLRPAARAGAVAAAERIVNASVLAASAGTSEQRDEALEARFLLASALTGSAPGRAEPMLCTLIADADAAGHVPTAAKARDWLAGLLAERRAITAAVTMATEAADLVERSGTRPWSVAYYRAVALQHAATSDPARVLVDVAALVDALPDRGIAPSDAELAAVWAAHERLLVAGVEAALAGGDWKLAVDYAAQNLASQRARGATVTEIAYSQFQLAAAERHLYPEGIKVDTFTSSLECLRRTEHFSAAAQVAVELARIAQGSGVDTAPNRWADEALAFAYRSESPAAVVATSRSLAAAGIGDVLGDLALAALVATATTWDDADAAAIRTWFTEERGTAASASTLPALLRGLGPAFLDFVRQRVHPGGLDAALVELDSRLSERR